MLASRLCLGVVLLTAGGCASAGSGTLADRFIRQGTPVVDVGGPRPLSSRAARSASPLEHASIAEVASRMSSTVSSLESVNPDLGEAVLRLRLAPTADHHLAVARIYRRLGVLDTAYDYLARSLALNGPDPVVHDQLARLWRDWGQPGTGLSHAYQAVYLAPDWPSAHNTLGTLLFAMGQRADARERFEQAVALDPDAAYALQNLCVLFQAAGRTREAITACRQADAARRRAEAGSRQGSR